MKPAVLILTALLIATCTMPAAIGSETESHGSMNNHAPRVIQIDGVPEEVVPLAGGQREITFSFMAKDANGWQDIVRAEVALYAPDNQTFLREADVTGVTGGNGASHWFNATFTMWYYELPTHGQNYTLHIRVVDQEGLWSPPRYAEFEYAEMAAIQIVTTADGGETNETSEDQTEPTLDFGGAEPGSESGVTEVTVRNTGNVVIDLELYGTHLVNEDGYVIPVSSVRFSLDGADMANETSLALDPTVLTSFDLFPGAESTASIWWRLSVPTGEEQYVPAGTYDGSVTINGLAG